MTKIVLLEALKAETLDAISDLLLPVAMQAEDTEQPSPKTPDVYLMRLPDSSSAKKKTPYVLHTILTGKDIQKAGERPESAATVRSIFAVYHSDEQEGGLALLNLMERVRIRLLEKVVIGGQFQLDLENGVETMVYPDDTAPYFAGEMISTWSLPAVQRNEVRKWL